MNIVKSSSSGQFSHIVLFVIQFWLNILNNFEKQFWKRYTGQLEPDLFVRDVTNRG